VNDEEYAKKFAESLRYAFGINARIEPVATTPPWALV